MTNPSPLTRLTTHGYVIIPSFLPPSTLSALRTASSTLISLSSAGQWPHVRTTGKQFPPWDPSLVPHSAGIWGVQHLLHPSLPLPPSQREAFVKLYFSPALLSLSREILSLPPPDGLVMELFNLLCGPSDGKGFELSWHRDDIPASATEEEERERVCKPGEVYSHTQWNLPLRRGIMVFYDNNILHRGVYFGGNVLQHGVGSWVERADFSCLGEGEERKTAEGMRRRLVEMGRAAGEVGYSLVG
ncbi:uncharacterized protein PODANS_4_9560 [Podospora anserina S mat+]|uniref:Podospora anserina S mat+ genomic DNA chromosome 4, supercontig 4 n=1 Tax=Podospora anserina (strain S / ATCC MYA-4624 / DSM 980 / FGSC 10383) TaxID=515849 RepID=B2AQV6_PODAN|nr:uncharacterized protein PODANS_4_9560 [Podospora anserina S mat+]CAP66534.1 unnamed protein product [Podospora anserina S mat+]